MFWDDASKSALRAARDAVSILEAQKARALGAQGVPASPPSVRAPAAAALDAKGWHRDSGKTSAAAVLDATGWHRDGTTGARLTQRILFGGQALTVRDETGNWAPHDERYLALLVEHGQPCSGNESGLKAFSDAFPTRPVGSITGHISVFNVQEYNKWQQGEGQGKWGGWPGWKK